MPVSARDAAILRTLDARRSWTHAPRVSTNQLHRWRSWRRVGLIPRSPERIRGYRPGIEIPAREVRWIEVAAGLIGQYRSADVVALRLAAASFPLDENALKLALLDHFDRGVVRRERSDAWPYRRAARGKGSVARIEARIAADYRRLGSEPPEPVQIERGVEAHARHRRNVLEGTEAAKAGKVSIVGVGEVPVAVTLEEARQAIVEAPAGNVIDALRLAGSPEHAVDYLARGLVQRYRDALG
jgi:hypothetical protein